MPYSTQRAAIILAAGKSTRMKSAHSKVLHSVGGRSLLEWVTALARSVGVEKIICVVGGDNEDVQRKATELGLEIAIQEPQRGTADAVGAAKNALKDFDGNVIVLCADAPLIRKDTVEATFNALENGADVVAVGFVPEDAGSYGRLVVKNGQLLKIVEAKEASEEELAIPLCNSGMLAANTTHLFAALADVGCDNVKGEYYLTDLIEITSKSGKNVVSIEASADEVLGINSRVDLAIAERAFQEKMRQDMLENGVTLRDPQTTFFSWDTQIEADADIGANVVFGVGVRVETGAVIHPFCHIEGAHVGPNTQIGPFARLRLGANLAEGAKAGNFVEIKKANIGKGSKINHLSYIGDAEIASGVNVGAGTITCNYDGYRKHKTTIGEGAFIGTHTSLIAPVTIGAGAYLATGGVITKDVPADALALGRAPQTHKEGWAKRYREAQEKLKAKREDKTSNKNKG
ncbi:MAG: bifunctional N-acetylglucosamine-1-phosphate uridyltransferase/glucosamine-1-phosphate acetyltransferase [Robiginitomaculum sp.]|nr:MAG: bifunctional N-acetylglucosamine-1-phosphate uridyltransferase/glucosamine-1-phosphate acetyltransferase [Robiginitomaculum sp.]